MSGKSTKTEHFSDGGFLGILGSERTGHTITDSKGNSTQFDNWGNTTGHDVKSGTITSHHGGGMTGWTDSKLGSGVTGKSVESGNRTERFDSQGNRIGFSVRSDNKIEHFSVDGKSLGHSLVEDSSARSSGHTMDVDKIEGGGGVIATGIRQSDGSEHAFSSNNCVDPEDWGSDDSEFDDDNSEDDTGNQIFDNNAYAEGKERGRHDAYENLEYANNDDQSQQYCDGYYDGWQQAWHEIGDRNTGWNAGRHDAYENNEYANNDDQSQQYCDGYYDGWQQAWHEIGDKNTGCKAGYYDASKGNAYANNDDQSQQYCDGYYDGWQYAWETIRENEQRDLLENWADVILAA